MVIGDFDFMRPICFPHKTDPPLIIDPDAMLSDPLPFQPLQAICWWGQQILQVHRIIEHGQFPLSGIPEAEELLDHSTGEETFGLFVSKTSYHSDAITLYGLRNKYNIPDPNLF